MIQEKTITNELAKIANTPTRRAFENYEANGMNIVNAINSPNGKVIKLGNTALIIDPIPSPITGNKRLKNTNINVKEVERLLLVHFNL